MKVIRLSAAILAALAVVTARAQEEAVPEQELEVDLKVASAHLWRGEVLNDEAVIQPSLTVTAGDWALNLWGTWDVDETTNSSARQRIDATMEYTWIKGSHILSPGITAYVYHDATYASEDDTVELSVEYAYLVLSEPTKKEPEKVLLIPSLTVNYDFGEIDGVYSAVSLRRSFGLVENQMDLDLRVDLGMADKNYANAKFSYPATGTSTNAFVPDSAGLIDLTVTASTPIILNEQWTITPSFKFMTLLDSDIEDAAKAAGEEAEETALAISVTALF